MPSFDVVSEVNQHELSNAVDQANREVENRFDFKGSGAKFTLTDKLVILTAPSDFQVQQMKDILGKPDVAATGISYMYKSLGIEIIAKDKVNISAILCGNFSNRKEPMFKAMEEAFKFKTAEGIGIGSTEAQIIKAFGQPTKRRGDKLLYKDKRMSFTLDGGKVIGIWVK